MPWGPDEMRTQLGGIGLGAMILYRETATKGGRGNVSWDHPDNRLVLATGPLAGLPVWGTGGLTVVTIGAGTNGPTSTQANGFFGTNLKYCGYDAIIFQGEAKRWVYLYIDDDVVELRDAADLKGLDTWDTQNALSQKLGLSGHALSVYSIGPAGENLVRFAAIQGDYGHVASKNGVGAVMGKKRVKAVAIVKGTKGLRAADPRGVMQAADDIAHDLRTDPSARSLYEYGTLPGVVNLSKMGALPVKNYTTNLTLGVDMTPWEAPNLREGFDHRGHQCNACGMHHCHMSVIRSGENKGKIVDEPEYEGWSGAGWTIGLTDPQAVAWLNTELDRACLDVNEFGWMCGWVMECYEKGYITKEQLGFELPWGDVKGAARLIRIISTREGFGNVLAEGSSARPKSSGAPPKSVRSTSRRVRYRAVTITGRAGRRCSTPARPVPPLWRPGTRCIPPSWGSLPASTRSTACRWRSTWRTCEGGAISRIPSACASSPSVRVWRTSAGPSAPPPAGRIRSTKPCASGVARRPSIVSVSLRCGHTGALEYPSARYGSTPVDGPAKGQAIRDQWETMLDTWYAEVGYDRKTGKPLPQTLRDLGLDELATALWSKKSYALGRPLLGLPTANTFTASLDPRPGDVISLCRAHV